MIIDFHTHVFPDKIFERTIALLSEKGGIPAFSSGSINGMLGEMERGGIDIAINQPVLTRPDQFDSILRYAQEINETFAASPRRLMSFAGIHPACEGIDKKMALIQDCGFLGVKIHPDYQNTYANDEGYVKILECAKKLDLIVITHAGIDTAYQGSVPHCSPSHALDLIRQVPHGKLVLAHYGANFMFDEVYELLCGEDVYFDTAYILRFIGKEMFKKILHKHGEERVLFATDSPWSPVKEDVEILRSFELGEENEEKIFSGNARRLLGI